MGPRPEKVSLTCIELHSPPAVPVVAAGAAPATSLLAAEVVARTVPGAGESKSDSSMFHNNQNQDANHNAQCMQTSLFNR